MTRRCAPIVLVVALALALAVGCDRRSDAPKAGATGVLAKLPTLEAIDGRSHDLRKEAGNVVLINRWATWCGPCREEIPVLAELGRQYAGKGLRVYGLSDEEAAIQKPAAERLAIDYPLLREASPLPKPFESSGFVPETYVIARDGRLAEVILGARDRRALEAIVRPLLEEPRP